MMTTGFRNHMEVVSMKPSNVYIRQSEILRKLSIMHHKNPALSVSVLLKAMRLARRKERNGPTSPGPR